MTLPFVGKCKAANYPGDVTDSVGQLVGPGMDGTMLVATDAVYDEDTDTTRVEFDVVADVELRRE